MSMGSRHGARVEHRRCTRDPQRRPGSRGAGQPLTDPPSVVDLPSARPPSLGTLIGTDFRAVPTMIRSVILAALSALAPTLAPGEAAFGNGASAALLDVIELDVRDLTTIDWEPGDPIPSDIQRYDGRRVLIRGYMHQSAEGRVDQFPLVADSCQCADTLLPHHYVDIELERGHTRPIPGEFEVLGELSVGAVEDADGFVVSLYRLEGEIF